MQSKPKVIITKDVAIQINYLHNLYPDKEWSGILFYEESNKTTNINELVLTCKGVWPMNVGSAAYTSFNTDDSIIDANELFNPNLDLKLGLIHTHVGMSAFFSGTDLDELKQNCNLFDYYLSLVVNQKCDAVAKIACHCIADQPTVTYKDKYGNKFIKNLDSFNNIIDCEVVFQLPESFIKRAEGIKPEEFITNNYYENTIKNSHQTMLFDNKTLDKWDYNNKQVSLNSKNTENFFYAILNKIGGETSKDRLSIIKNFQYCKIKNNDKWEKELNDFCLSYESFADDYFSDILDIKKMIVITDNMIEINASLIETYASYSSLKDLLNVFKSIRFDLNFELKEEESYNQGYYNVLDNDLPF